MSTLRAGESSFMNASASPSPPPQFHDHASSRRRSTGASTQPSATRQVPHPGQRNSQRLLVKWIRRRRVPGWDENGHGTSRGPQTRPVDGGARSCHCSRDSSSDSSRPEAEHKADAAGLAYAYAASVALSRVHAGVHYPSDVLGFRQPVGPRDGAVARAAAPDAARRRPGGPRAAGFCAALSAPVIVAVALVLVRYRAAYRASGDARPARVARECAWRSITAKRADSGPVNEPTYLYTGMLGVMFGLAIGQSLKHLLPHLPYPPNARAAVLRAVLGNIGLIGLFEGIAAMTPKKPISVYTALRLKYAMVPVYILLLAPVCFSRVGV